MAGLAVAVMSRLPLKPVCCLFSVVDSELLFQQCDPNRENLCVFGGGCRRRRRAALAEPFAGWSHRLAKHRYC